MQMTCASNQYYFKNIKNEYFTLLDEQLGYHTCLTGIFKAIYPLSA